MTKKRKSKKRYSEVWYAIKSKNNGFLCPEIDKDLLSYKFPEEKIVRVRITEIK